MPAFAGMTDPFVLDRYSIGVGSVLDHCRMRAESLLDQVWFN